MGKVTSFLFKKLTMSGKGGSYNIDTGTLIHPRRGEGKANIKSKTKVTKEKK